MKKLLMFILLLGMAAHAFGQKGPKTAEEKANKFSEKITTELGLNSDQKKKVYDLTLEQQKSKQALLAKHQGNKEGAHSEMKALRKTYTENLKSILTPEQWAKWEEMKKHHKDKVKTDSIDAQ